MPRFEKVSGGSVYLRGIDERVSVGDVVDVSDVFAEFLEVRSDFRVVEGGASEGEPDAWHDWNEEDWLEIGYEQRAEDVREGRVDEHLEEIEGVETSETVKDAVDERRED